MYHRAGLVHLELASAPPQTLVPVEFNLIFDKYAELVFFVCVYFLDQLCHLAMLSRDRDIAMPASVLQVLLSLDSPDRMFAPLAATSAPMSLLDVLVNAPPKPNTISITHSKVGPPSRPTPVVPGLHSNQLYFCANRLWRDVGTCTSFPPSTIRPTHVTQPCLLAAFLSLRHRNWLPSYRSIRFKRSC